MLLNYPYAQNYLLTALESAPLLISVALQGMTDDEADYRHDPERFTIREVLAHLADWEPVFLERLTRIRDEDYPLLIGYDEAVWAKEHDYAHSSWQLQTELFAKRRSALVEFIQTVSGDDWPRTGNRPEIGVLSLQELALLIPLHDLYHLEQITEWRTGYRK